MNRIHILGIVSAMFCAALTVQAQVELTHRYLFDGNLNDSVGAINGTPSSTGTYSDAPSFVADAPSGAPAGAQSVLLGGARDDSKRSGVSFGAGTLSATSGSISLWFRHDLAKAATSDVDYLLTVGTGNWDTGIKVFINNNSSNLQMRAGGPDQKVVVGTYNGVVQDAWYHAAITWETSGSSTIASYYINGNLVNSVSIAGTIAIGTGSFNLGNWSYPAATSSSYLVNQFSGAVYDLQIYEGALSASEVAYLAANAGGAITIPEPSSLTALAGASVLGAVLLRRPRR